MKKFLPMLVMFAIVLSGCGNGAEVTDDGLVNNSKEVEESGLQQLDKGMGFLPDSLYSVVNEILEDAQIEGFNLKFIDTSYEVDDEGFEYILYAYEIYKTSYLYVYADIDTHEVINITMVGFTEEMDRFEKMDIAFVCIAIIRSLEGDQFDLVVNELTLLDEVTGDMYKNSISNNYSYFYLSNGEALMFGAGNK